MTEQPKKKRGRPPHDPTQATGRASFHVGLRLSDARRDQVMRLVEEAQERARAARVPQNITPSSLIHSWIIECIEREIARSDGEKKRRK